MMLTYYYPKTRTYLTHPMCPSYKNSETLQWSQNFIICSSKTFTVSDTWNNHATTECAM